jgi:hypothetical protein
VVGELIEEEAHGHQHVTLPAPKDPVDEQDGGGGVDGVGGGREGGTNPFTDVAEDLREGRREGGREGGREGEREA